MTANELYTDVGNSRRLAAAYGEVVRYVPAWNKWLTWDGSRWVKDEQLNIEMRAKAVIRSLYYEASEIPNEAERGPLVSHALQSERVGRLRAMVDLLKSEPGICVEPEQLDSDPFLFNCRNGTLDLRTGELRPHSRDDLITKLSPVEFDPDARDPFWDGHLAHVTRGNSDLADYLQKAAGYSMTGLTIEEIVLMLVGGPNTGKTTHIESLMAAFGDYATSTDAETFLRWNQPRGARNDIACLAGARLVCASELPAGRHFDEVTLKRVTGGDTIKARFLYGEHFEFKPQFTVYLASNHKPTVRDGEPAIWRRLKLVLFDDSVPEGKVNKKLKLHLTDPSKAGPAILAWAVEGALKWQKDGLREPAVVREATEAYRAETEVFAVFLDDRCAEAPEQWAPSVLLFRRYREWAETNGFKYHLGPQRFRQVLRGRGHVPEKRGGERGWRGIGLVQPKPIIVAKKSA